MLSCECSVQCTVYSVQCTVYSVQCGSGTLLSQRGVNLILEGQSQMFCFPSDGNVWN